MKIPKINIRRGLARVVYGVLAAVIVIFIILSPLAKYLLEKYDVKLIGREATIGWVYLNPFTGFVYLHDLTIYEMRGDSVFLSVKGASANFALYKLLSKKVEIEKLTIDRPWVKVVQKKDSLNFDDVIERFRPGKSDPNPSWHVTLLNTDILDGEFHYIEKTIPINYFIKNLTIIGPGKTSDVDTLTAKFSFKDGKGNGVMKGGFTINMKTLDYNFDVAVDRFDLEIIRQYIWELINYGMFRSRLDATIKATGNFQHMDNISMKGVMLLSDFHLGRTNEDPYIKFDRLALAIKELSPARDKYIFDSITLHAPYLKYEIYDSLDNAEALFGKNGKNITDITQQTGRFNLVIEIARYIKTLSRNFFRSDFQIGKLGIFKGNFAFNDFSLFETFSIRAHPVTIVADSVNRKNKRVKVSLKAELEPYGRANFLLSINPRDSGDFDLKFDIEKIPASLFNPYLVSETSFPLDRGTLELNGLWNVRNGNIKSDNHVLIIDPRLTKRIRNKDAKWIPMPLIMSLVRDRGNVMDYEVPITGDLRHPKFHLKDVVFDVIKNIFVKPATTAYRLKVKELEAEIEKTLMVKWDVDQRSLTDHQVKFVKNIAQFLKDHPTSSLVVHPIEYETKEKEHILFYETKKKYFLIIHKKQIKDYNEEDSLQVTKMSVRDPGLVKHIRRHVSDTSMFTLQEKCFHFVGHKVVSDYFTRLLSERKKSFSKPFADNGTLKQVKIAGEESSVPYNGFSYFKLEYPTGIDDDLREAYEEMRKLDDELPRKKYLKERRQSK